MTRGEAVTVTHLEQPSQYVWSRTCFSKYPLLPRLRYTDWQILGAFG